MIFESHFILQKKVYGYRHHDHKTLMTVVYIEIYLKKKESLGDIEDIIKLMGGGIVGRQRFYCIYLSSNYVVMS